MRLDLVMALALLASGCGGDLDTVQGGDGPGDADTEGPVIRHDPITTAQTYGVDILVDAQASDESGIFNMTLYYRRETSVEWEQKAMLEIGDIPGEGENDPPWTIFQGTIRGEDVGSGGMFYFFTAIDDSDASNESCLGQDDGTVKADCEPEAWHFNVDAQ
jgi:hypothetical protein